MDFEPNNWATRLFWLRRDLRYRATVYAFVLGSAAHLWLLDAAQPAWMPSNILYVIGLVFLVLRSYLIGWTLCTIAISIPLLFLRDQLTQSMYLVFVSASAALFEFWVLSRKRPLSNSRLLATIGWMGVVTYGWASIHKINRDFFDPEMSCAVYGMDKVERYFGLATTTIDGSLNSAVPVFALALEASIVVFYLIGKRRFAWIAAVIFHIPLTLTMAPAFAFVMATGHVAMMGEEELLRFMTFIKTHRIWPTVVALTLTSVSLAIHGAWPEWSMVPKEFLLWFALIVFVFSPWQKETRKKSPPYWLPVALFIFNGITPYTGLQYRHAAAMLSNLRIDSGCWNSYVFPEALRWTDDYVRIDQVYFREPGANLEYEAIVLDQLWSPPQIRQMKRNWCKEESQPLFLSGTFRGERWTTQNLCDDAQPWPFPNDGVFGIEVFGDYLRFQKNLQRECPQPCIH